MILDIDVDDAQSTLTSTNDFEYLSCRHIERSLVFFPGNVRPCGANPITGGTPIIAPFVGGDLSIEAVRAGRNRIKDSHKRGVVVEECLECPSLQKLAWESEALTSDMPDGGEIDEISLTHFTTCNIRCNYCYTVQKDAEFQAPLSKVPRIFDTIETMLKTGKLIKGATIRYAGGEPTLLPEFDNLITLFSEYDCKQEVITNTVKRSQGLIDGLKRGNIKVVMGIDAATPEVYKAIKKMDYNEVVWANAAEYAAAAHTNPTSSAWGKFIVLEENLHETVQFAERAEAAGITQVYYDVDASRIASRKGGRAEMPEEITDKIALLQYECFMRGMEFDFMTCGQGWMTPERIQRIDAEFKRLQETRGAIAPDRYRLGAVLLNRLAQQELTAAE